MKNSMTKTTIEIRNSDRIESLHSIHHRFGHRAARGLFKTFLLSVALALGAGTAVADQGVSSNEILIGTIQDLSGPLAGYGKAVRNGMQMRIDEVNEQGGVHGRKLRLVTEDSGYDPKRAVLAAQK
ncbi:MAG: hypothetical protein RL369_468, partial [Pseudomonadota bacterium]